MSSNFKPPTIAEQALVRFIAKDAERDPERLARLNQVKAEFSKRFWLESQGFERDGYSYLVYIDARTIEDVRIKRLSNLV